MSALHAFSEGSIPSLGTMMTKVLVRLERLYDVENPDEALDLFNESMGTGNWEPIGIPTRTIVFSDEERSVKEFGPWTLLT